MTDHAWLQATIHHCPSRRSRTARLLAEYVNCDDERVSDGGTYEAESASLGSSGELAGRLITLAPQCSFAIWQDGHYSSPLGQVTYYTPRLGRFDGETHGGDGAVILGRAQVDAVRASATRAGWLDRDYLLRRDSERPGAMETMARWELRCQPGLDDALEVAYGRPWQNMLGLDGAPAAPEKRGAWLAVIDLWAAEEAARRRKMILGLVGTLAMAGLHREGERLRGVLDAGYRYLPGLLGVVAGDVERALAAAPDGTARDVPFMLRVHADAVRAEWDGRRRP